MKTLTFEDLENLCLGSAILGSGGGGDPSLAKMIAQVQFERYGPASVISLEELEPGDLIVPLAVMGAPLINQERLLSGREFEILLQKVKSIYKRAPSVLMAGEIGGANAFAPLFIASKLGLPVLDADLIGRAFPELQMNSCNLKGMNASPAIIVDCFGNNVVVETQDVQGLERIARGVTMSMGSSAAIGLHIMNQTECLDGVVPGSLTRACALGRIIHDARRQSTDPIKALLNEAKGSLICSGSIIDIHQDLRQGFLYGSVTLLNDEERIKLSFQNEYLIAQRDDITLASTPDILMLIEEGSGSPITSESLRYGLQTSLIAFEAPPIWKTAAGLALVGPKVFGYEEIR